MLVPTYKIRPIGSPPLTNIVHNNDCPVCGTDEFWIKQRSPLSANTEVWVCDTCMKSHYRHLEEALVAKKIPSHDPIRDLITMTGEGGGICPECASSAMYVGLDEKDAFTATCLSCGHSLSGKELIAFSQLVHTMLYPSFQLKQNSVRCQPLLGLYAAQLRFLQKWSITTKSSTPDNLRLLKQHTIVSRLFGISNKEAMDVLKHPASQSM